MIIQSLERGFAVIKIVESTQDTDILVCKDLLETGEKLYTLVCIKNPDLVYRTMPLFTEQNNNYSFTDYVECFSQGGNFYVVFRYYDKPRLYDKLSENFYSLKERLDIAKNIFSAITLQNMPSPMQYEVLTQENLLMDDSLSVYFNYNLKEIPIYDILSPNRFKTEAAGLLRTLFDQELANKSCPELEEFIEKLETGDFETYLGVYREYDRVYSIMVNILEVGEIEPQGLLFKLWEKIKKAARFIKPVLTAAIIVAAFIYLLYSLNSSAAAKPDSGISFGQIGTVVIEMED